MKNRTAWRARIIPLAVAVAVIAVIIAVLLGAPTGVIVACAIVPSALGPLLYTFLPARKS